MEFVEDITIDDDFRRVLDDSFGILAIKLSEAIKRINDTLNQKSEKRPGFLEFARKVKKPKYVLLKSTIDEAINAIEFWQRQVDPSWFMMMRLSNDAVDKTLRRLVERAEDTKVIGDPSSSASGGTRENMRKPLQVAEGMRDVLRRKPKTEIHVFLKLLDLENRPILYSTSRVARPRSMGNTKWLIVDSVKCRPGTNLDALTRDVRILAQKLSKADPLRFGLLNCMGVMRVPAKEEPVQPASFDFVFQCPYGMELLQCLRQKMLDNPGVVSLSRRMAIAKELARSVSYVHTFNFVHKNIRPESILLFEDLDLARSLTFLVGFDHFRPADGHTNLRGDKEWDCNIYRHPSRQGEFLSEEYKMHHDIYSLGVWLLEIGLWESFVSYDDLASPVPGPRLNGFQSWLEKNGHRSDILVTCYLKDYFTDLARSVLPQMTGDRYAVVVVSCLTCLEEGSSDFGDVDESQDRDGILLGVRFIQRILMRLEEVIV
jgi:hypothetical protein